MTGLLVGSVKGLEVGDTVVGDLDGATVVGFIDGVVVGVLVGLDVGLREGVWVGF